MNLIRKFVKYRQNKINSYNRSRLTNTSPTLICSNCTGGVLYHWLGLEFRSPFINLYMDNSDFLTAMENFNEFINGDVVEDLNSGKDYPVGIGFLGVKIHFMHYPDFKTALEKWNNRKKKIDTSNMAIMLTNLGVNNKSYPIDYISIITRFNKLPFKHKLIFSGTKLDIPNVVYLRGYKKVQSKKNIFNTQSILGKRYIDQFDYVDFINRLK